MRKLKSSKGVSVVLAMMIFLVASTISMVVISAAVTGVKSVRDDGIRQKEFLAISSAGKLLSEGISESSVTVTSVTTEVEGEEPETTVNYQTTGVLGDTLRLILVGLPAKTGHTISVEAGDGTVCSFDFQVNPAGSYEDPTDPYKIKGTVTQNNGEQKIYLTAWIPSSPIPVVSTQQIEEEHKTVTTSVTVYRWNKTELSTIGGTP